jgi:hypothetical protein
MTTQTADMTPDVKTTIPDMMRNKPSPRDRLSCDLIALEPQQGSSFRQVSVEVFVQERAVEFPYSLLKVPL